MSASRQRVNAIKTGKKCPWASVYYGVLRDECVLTKAFYSARSTAVALFNSKKKTTTPCCSVHG